MEEEIEKKSKEKLGNVLKPRTTHVTWLQKNVELLCWSGKYKTFEANATACLFLPASWLPVKPGQELP